MRKIYLLLGIVLLLVMGCEKDDTLEPIEGIERNELEGEGMGPGIPKYFFTDSTDLATTKFYQFYRNRSRNDTLNQRSILEGTPSLLDSLILEKTVIYEKKGTRYYTIPYKYHTEAAFYNLYVQETQSSFIPFKLKYNKGPDYPDNPHDLQVEIVPFIFSQAPGNGSPLTTRSSCTPTTFYVEVKCTGAGHWPGESSCKCGKSDLNCDPAYTLSINGQVCQESTLDDDPDPGGNPGGGSGGGSGSPGDPTTNPNDPTQPGGGFDCIAGYDCAGDPYQDQQLYNQCKYSLGGDNCWEICEYANCTLEDNARYELFQKLNVTEQEISSLTNERVNQLGNYVGSGTNVEKNAFASEAVRAWINDGEVDFETRLINNPNLNDFLKDRMSSSELALFDTLTPMQKALYLQAAAEAYTYAEIFYPRPVRNRKGDAVKHTLWNALSTIYIGATLTKQLTDAHEEITFDSGYQNHYKEKQMDLYNNAKGIELGNQYGGTFAVFFQLVENAKNNGELGYLSNLEFTGSFWKATSNSVLIPTNQ
ncbi:DUF6973 domain-containing protein [Salegentibacter maritimus]|uniref:DUF6973 domain-containing protein n=1 Tax=Salegentibacter maritimus TaxID=2794347 RepID=UPI0018E4B4F8|nr:hypothetical protein [Salegentibacter maritimus]MBI6117643.1 hypothetical protein [Salegentibacter maritimus]